MKRAILIALFFHILCFSVIWIGFPVPVPKNRVEFYYQGSDSFSDDLSTNNLPVKENVPLVMPGIDAESLNHWIKIRDLDKPRK